MIYWVTVKKNLIKRSKNCYIYIIVKISYYDLLGNSKKNLIKKGKKMLNAISYYDLLGNNKKKT